MKAVTFQFTLADGGSTQIRRCRVNLAQPTPPMLAGLDRWLADLEQLVARAREAGVRLKPERTPAEPNAR